MEKLRAALLATTLAAGIALAGGSAYAADIAGVVQSPAPANTEGLYVSVFGGYAVTAMPSGNYGDSTSFDAPLNSGYVVGGAIGTHLMPNLRGEVEASYVSHDFSGEMRLHLSGPPALSGSVPDSGSLSTLYLLGNLWYDLDMGNGVTPYVGGGIGGAVIMPNNFTFASGTEVFDTDAWALAGQLGAGIQVKLADSMSLDLGYRAKGVFNATITPTSGGTNNATNVHYIDQTIQAGLTVGF